MSLFSKKPKHGEAGHAPNIYCDECMRVGIVAAVREEIMRKRKAWILQALAFRGYNELSVIESEARMLTENGWFGKIE